jgi:Fe2+ or Zn2+ uptake regulation protein
MRRKMASNQQQRKQREKILKYVQQFTHEPMTEEVHTWLTAMLQVLNSILG